MMKTISNQIQQMITHENRGVLLFPNDFESLGSSEAIRVALHRFERRGFIKRVAQGAYVRPKISRLIGEVLPSADEVVHAIAKREHIRLMPSGAYALHALGLSTQVPSKLTYLTDGSPREITIGKSVVRLKKTSPKNLMAKGKISALVIQALREIGNGRVTAQELTKIIALLKSEAPQDLAHDIPLAPAWIQKIMNMALVKGDA